MSAGFDPNEVYTALQEMKLEVKKFSGTDFEKLERCEKAFDKYEDHNKELMGKLSSEEKSRIELDEAVEKLSKEFTDAGELHKAAEEKSLERIHALEIDVAKKSALLDRVDTPVQETEGYKALRNHCIYGDDLPSELKSPTMTTLVSSDGGVLAPKELDDMIMKDIVEISPMRSVCRVKTTSMKSLEVPQRGSVMTATFEGETDPASDDISQYRSTTLTPFRLTVTVPITQDLLMDSAFNMDAEIMDDARISFAEREGYHHILGNLTKTPEGITEDATLQSNSLLGEHDGSGAPGTLADVTAADLIRLSGELKRGQNPGFMLSRRTLAHVRAEQASTSGVFIWDPGLGGGNPGSIAGYPYTIAEDMPDFDDETNTTFETSPGNFAVAFGDFMRGYLIVDRTGMTVIRDNVTMARQAIVLFTIRKWTTGKVLMHDGIKLLWNNDGA